MKPDRTNYEIWILDYLDGRLNENQVCLLMKFLDENPEIREEVSFLAGFNNAPKIKKYPFKNKLIKSITDLPEDQFELLCIKALENDLSPEEAEELRQYLESYPEKRNIFNQIQKIKLNPPVIEFRHKNKLRKQGVAEKTIRFLIPALGAAACMAVVIWIYTPRENKNQNNIKIISSNEDIQRSHSEKIADPEIASHYPTEIFTTELKKNNTTKKETVYVPADTTSESIESISREITVPSPLSFNNYLGFNHISFNNMKLDIKFNNAISFNEKTNHGFKYHLAKLVREKILKTNSEWDDAIKSYEIAEAGIKGLNKILGWQMSFDEYIDEKGELMAINFSSKLVKLNIPVKRDESNE